MATQALVDQRIGDGARLIEKLDDDGLDVPVAMWLYSSEWGEWRLLVATKRVQLLGPRAVYGQIIQTLRRLPGISLRSNNITVVGLDDARVQAIRASYRIPDGGEGVWLGRTAVGNVFFEDAYLYRAR
jgi:hypothetical protein